ncbi:hypothetical protein [Flammeovirga sp. SJP92]|uniref:hypothetical protein n=1 Tax=Flammeovirga sp. SJP92 TaxID=1775430 RepID=UPI0012F7CB5D|nr:hypothetical protein [Flammeovirga sp. SJP92]
MTNQFTLRDILVYTLTGLFFSFLIVINLPDLLKVIPLDKNNNTVVVLLIVPLFYLLGHFIMGIDELLLNRLLPKVYTYKKKAKIFTKIFYGYRNNSLKVENEISESDFLKKCDSLIKESNYDKAEYYQAMSDLFKGLVMSIYLIGFLTIILKIFSETCLRSIISEDFTFNLKYWILLLEGLMFFIFLYRARMFSAYYVRHVLRLSESLRPDTEVNPYTNSQN